MKLRWTIILFIINALLLWGIVEQLATPPAERSFNSLVRSFLPLSRADWDGIGVSTAAGGWKVSRDRWGHWWLKSPVEWPAKDGIVSRMDGYLATLQVDSAFAVADLGRVGQSLKSYGLDNPRAVLEVMSGAKTLSYKIGNETPLGNKVYALSADEKEVWVVDSGLNKYLSLAAADLRKEGFFPFSIIELESVEVDQAGVLTLYERKTGGNLWQLKLGEKNIPLKPGAWEDSLTKLSTTPTTEAPAASVAQSVLKSLAPAGRINFQTLYGRQSLLLGDADKTGQNRFVQWEGEKNGFYIPASALGILKAENFLETRPIPVNPSDATAIDWTTSAGTISLRKLESGAWVIASRENAPADPDAVKNLLERLSSVDGRPAAQSKAVMPVGGEKIRLQTASRTLELTVARSKVFSRPPPTAVHPNPSKGDFSTPSRFDRGPAATEELTGRGFDDGAAPQTPLAAPQEGGAVNPSSENKTSVTAEGGCVVYSTDEWPAAPTLGDLIDRRLLTAAAPSGEIMGVVFKTLIPAPREAAYATASPQAQALRAIVKNSFKAKRWIEAGSAEEKALASPQYQLEARMLAQDKSSPPSAPLIIDLWKTPQGWTGRIGGKTFEADGDLAKFLDALVVL
jgi:hypothetical protein